MKFVGKVEERIEGSSIQVRMVGTLEVQPGQKVPVHVIVSSQAPQVHSAFGGKDTPVEFDLPAA